MIEQLNHFAHLSILALVCTSALMGCESSADVAHPQTYAREGISFRYPGNWKVSSDERDPSGFRTIIVETPGDGLAMIQHFEVMPTTSTRQYAELFAQMTAEEIPLGNVTASVYKDYTYTHPASKKVMEGVQERFAIAVLGESVPHVRAYVGFNDEFPRSVFICQVASEDLKLVKPGCDQVLQDLVIEDR